MHIVDTSGQKCPAPLIATRRALKNDETGETFQVLTDNITSFNNIARFLKDNNIAFTYVKEEEKWIMTITKGNAELVSPEAENYCSTGIPHFTRGNFVISFSSDCMGEGDEVLGHLLMKNFIKSIKDLDLLPSKMVFYNRGVYLATIDSQSANDLDEIEKMGVDLFFCATCVDHYSLRDKMTIGKLSNMFEIAQVMASASNVIKP